MEFLFILKKLIGMLLMPISLIAIAFILSILLRNKKPRASLALGLSSVTLLLLLSFQPIANRLLYPIENQFPAFNTQQPVELIHVLGNCHRVNGQIPPHAQLCGTAIYRLVEGIRILNANPNSQLLLTGYQGSQPQTHAEVLAQVALQLGVSRERLIVDGSPKDTREESMALAEYLDQHRHITKIAIVTSASHMPRAFSMMKHELSSLTHSINIYAAPAYFSASAEHHDWKIETPALRKSERAFYEILGLIWFKLSS